MSVEFVSDDPTLTGVNFGLLRREVETYLILVPYTSNGLGKLKPGSLIAVENFKKTVDGQLCFTVLEATKIMPVHYAIGPSADRLESEYIEFATEALAQAGREWDQAAPQEETTKIRVEAIPTHIMISSSRSGITTEPDDSYPKPGGRAYLVTAAGADAVINRGLPDERTIKPAALIANPEVRLKINAKELTSTHFAAFGFTKSGKSNLSATTVADLLNASGTTSSSIAGLKTLVVDYMNEYFPLLADVFAGSSQQQPQVRSNLILADADRPMLSMLRNTYADSAHLDVRAGEVADRLLGRMLIPDEMADIESEIRDVLKTVVKERRVLVYSGPRVNRDAAERLQQIADAVEPKWLGRARVPIQGWLDAIQNDAADLTTNDMGTLAGIFRTYSTTGNMRSVIRDRTGDWVNREGAQVAGEIPQTPRSILAQMAEKLSQLQAWYLDLHGLPENLVLSDDGILGEMNGDGGPLLLVVTGDAADSLQLFLSRVGNRMYDWRRQNGTNQPPTLILVDEADEFLARDEENFSTTLAKSRRVAELIARRGRKLGVGLAIATQRVAFLDTKVMGQIHTYFVSKLPRKSDRDRVAEAYGIPVEIIDMSLSLGTGDWMVISHDALGMSGTPMLAHFDNSSVRVRRRLRPPAADA